MEEKTLSFSDKYYKLTGIRNFIETLDNISEDLAKRLIWAIPVKNYDLDNEERYDLLVEVIGDIINACNVDSVEELFGSDNVITRVEDAYLSTLKTEEEEI